MGQMQFLSMPGRVYGVMLLLLLLAIITIPGLGEQSLWVDEGWSVAFTDGQSPQDVVAQISEDRHPPLYFLSLWSWRQVTGDHAFTMRLLSSFAALLAGACLFRWGKALFGDLAGWLALLVFVLLDKQVDFSREIRHYSWLMLWVTASSWLLVAWINGSSRLQSRYAIFYTLTVIAGIYTHTLMFLVLLAQGVYALIILRLSQRFWRLAFLWLLAGIAFLPWSLVFIYQYTVLGGVGHHLPLEWEITKLLTPEYLGQPLALMIGLLILGVASAWIPSRKATPQAVLMPTLLLLLPLGLMILTGLANEESNFITERNLSLLIPPLMLLVGLGITVFDPFTRRALVIFLLINGLLTTSSHQLLPTGETYITAPRGENPPWRQISQAIADHDLASPVVMDVGGDAVVLRYHLREEVNEMVQSISIYDLLEHPDPLAALRFEQLGDTEGFWYVFGTNNPVFVDALPDWGYVRTAEYQNIHLGNPIYTYRYDRRDALQTILASYDNTFRLHKFYYPDSLSAGDDMSVSLWWSAAARPDIDYTVSVFLLNADGQLVAQHDGFPQEGHLPTSQWRRERLIYDAHTIPLPENLAAGTYSVNVKLYNPTGILLTDTDDEFFELGTLHITAD